MYIDEDTIRFYYSNYMYRVEPQFPPDAYPNGQMPPFPPLTQDPQGMPSSGPPNFIPAQPHSQGFGDNPQALTQYDIRPCIYRFVYIWSRTRGRFWSRVIFAGPKSISGYYWATNAWKYFAMNLQDIIGFHCF